MRPVKLPKGAKIVDGVVKMPCAKPRDAAQARSWAKGGRKGVQRVVTKAQAKSFNRT